MFEIVVSLRAGFVLKIKKRHSAFAEYLCIYFVYGKYPYASSWITSPERNFGSNQVVLGGIMLPLSAMSISCFIDTG